MTVLSTSANIEALKSVWLLGEEFLRDMMYTFKAMRAQAINDHKDLPYLLKNYNVVAQNPERWSNIRSFLAKVLNGLVKALNQSPFILPRYILVVLDKDLIANADLYDYGVSRMLEDTLKWLLININMVVESRKEDLIGKRAGAVSTTSEPHIIWIGMLKCPDYSMNKRVYSLARKFNQILQNVITGDRRSHYLPVGLETNSSYFDHIGNITQSGKIEYWRLVDSTMKEFNRGNTELQPFSSNATTKQENHHHHHQNQDRHRNTSHPWNRDRQHHHYR